MFHSEILSPWSFLTFWNGLPRIGRQLCLTMWFWHFSTHKIYVTVRGNSRNHTMFLYFSPILGRRFEKQGKQWDKVYLAFQTFSPGLEKNGWTKCGSENFPRTVTYILCVEKYQYHILMHSCLPIPGRPFQNVRKLHGLRISEWNLTKTMLTKSITNFCQPKPRPPSPHDFFRLIHSSKPKPENILLKVNEINKNYPHI